VDRRGLLQYLAGSLVLGPDAALAQSARQARVGWLSYLPAPDPALGLLREGLRALGHIEGKSYATIARYADNDFTRLPALVDELLAERIDVLVSRGPSVDFTKRVRDRVPVVFVYSGDPVAAGFADSLARPGRNMTGMTFMATQLCAKRVEVLKELLPDVKRIALLSNPEHAGELIEYRVTEDSARRLGAEVTRYLVHTPQDLAPAFKAIQSAKADATLVFPDSLTLNRRKEIAELAAAAKMPCMYGWTEFVDAGGLVSYGPTITEGFRALAVFTDKILKGGNASTIPIEQARGISLTLNLSAAKALGIRVPPALIVRADRVID
jgi:putative tryptophan/tyrosine transport system substrate-binding protein